LCVIGRTLPEGERWGCFAAGHSVHEEAAQNVVVDHWRHPSQPSPSSLDGVVFAAGHSVHEEAA
jgi:hypothetical protein